MYINKLNSNDFIGLSELSLVDDNLAISSLWALKGRFE